MKKWIVLVLALHAPAAMAVYKCVDEQGRTLIGDVPPAGCAKVEMYEVSPSGTVLRKIDPTPTPEQLKLRLEEQVRRKEAERAAAEQRRKDLALLNTFDSEQEIDVARDRNIEPIASPHRERQGAHEGGRRARAAGARADGVLQGGQEQGQEPSDAKAQEMPQRAHRGAQARARRAGEPGEGHRRRRARDRERCGRNSTPTRSAGSRSRAARWRKPEEYRRSRADAAAAKSR